MSLAKNFEANVKRQLLGVDNVYVLRLYDTMFDARGIHNPCDFIAYTKPNMILLECKTTAGAVGVILVWFYEKDTTLAFDIRALTEMKNQGIKSIRYDSSGNGIIKVNGIKAHKYFTYDFKPMLKEIKSWK